MGILGQIRKKAGEQAIRRSAHFNTRKKRIHNLQTAKSIGIIFQANSEEDYSRVHDYAKTLQAKKIEVKALGYLNDPLFLNWLMPVITFDFITSKQTNWFGRPKSEKYSEFVNRKFDICIDISPKDCIPMKFAAASSLATFKVGMFTAGRSMIYDFMLEMKDETDIGKMIDEADHYLNILKPA